MDYTPMQFFTDAVLRGPTIGCMLMCFCASLVGVIVFLNKQSLLGESLSHSAYPGVILGVILAGILNVGDDQEFSLSILAMGGAFLSAILGLLAIQFLQRRMKTKSDSALCFVLSVFFGIGLTLASHVQFAYSTLYRQAVVYLYGQAATMRDVHIWIYGVLAFIILSVVVLFYKEIKVLCFDRDYAKSIGINSQAVDTLVFLLIVTAVIIGIRSVGVVLMSAMLIAPAAAARQFTNKLSLLFILSALFGVASGYLGNYFSVYLSNLFEIKYPHLHLTLPTGPMIVLIATLFCLLALLFAPERGLLIRLIRAVSFRYRCMNENLLKAIWRMSHNQAVTFEQISRYQSASPAYIRFILYRLGVQGWLKSTPQGYVLTPEGQQRAAHIVRLHRLWEVYLADYLGVGAERVHRSAEEMEHIITPDLERELTYLLNDPKRDPHHQPIPAREY